MPNHYYLLSFETLRSELQRPAIFCNGAHYLLGHPGGHFSLDLKCDGDLRSDDSGEVRNNFICDSTRISSCACRVKSDGSVEATRRRWAS